MENEPFGSTQRFTNSFRKQGKIHFLSISIRFDFKLSYQEPPLRLRYESPINASPSRFKDHPRPFDYEEPELDRQSTHRSSLGRSIGTLPTYNGIYSPLVNRNSVTKLFDFVFRNFGMMSFDSIRVPSCPLLLLHLFLISFDSVPCWTRNLKPFSR